MLISLIKKIRGSSLQWHGFFAWFGALILLLYIVSGITHPLLSWTGPKAAKFFPPTAKISAEHLRAIPEIIQQQQLQSVSVAKVVPAENAPLLQITEADGLRRYFDLSTYAEKVDYDEQHAAWLARYYIGDMQASIRTISKQDAFDKHYPWVNRLLPVYKVVLDDSHNTTLYIYTELNALASISNNWKATLQTLFQVLHTWSFLDHIDNARVVLLALMMLTLIAFALTGMALVLTLSSRKIPQASRRWHRRMAYIIWLPILAFSTSGFYHLLQAAYGENTSGLKLNKGIALEQYDFNTRLEAFDQQNFSLLNQVAIVAGPNEELMYRVSLPATQSSWKKQSVDEHAHHIAKTKPAVSRQAIYKGLAKEQGAYYFSVADGKKSLLTDKVFAEEIALNYLQQKAENISQTSIVTHFGPNYDFRNKRLPVWRVDFDNASKDILFIDPATRIIVDHTKSKARYERYAFSFLHKWNFFVPLIGRKNRDIIIVIVLLSALFVTLAGIVMLLSKTRKNK